MNLYLDTEFNGHGGELISLAIADPYGSHWYGILPLPSDVHPWVAEHVVPLLDAMPDVHARYVPQSAGADAFVASLHKYLLERQGAHIYADWPHDFAHLMHCLAGETYDRALNYQCVMHLIQTPHGEPKPDTPHNALSDAMALMEWHRSQ